MFIVGFFSTLLLVMPRANPATKNIVHQKPDSIFLGRMALLVLSGIAAIIVGPLILLKTHCVQKILVRPLQSPLSRNVCRGYVQLDPLPEHRDSQEVDES